MVISISIDEAFNCLNLIEVGAMTELAPHPETSFSTSTLTVTMIQDHEDAFEKMTDNDLGDTDLS